MYSKITARAPINPAGHSTSTAPSWAAAAYDADFGFQNTTSHAASEVKQAVLMPPFQPNADTPLLFTLPGLQTSTAGPFDDLFHFGASSAAAGTSSGFVTSWAPASSTQGDYLTASELSRLSLGTTAATPSFVMTPAASASASLTGSGPMGAPSTTTGTSFTSSSLPAFQLFPAAGTSAISHPFTQTAPSSGAPSNVFQWTTSGFAP